MSQGKFISAQAAPEFASANRKPKQRAVVVAPGRGCYGKDELGYLSRYHSDKVHFIKHIDDYRKACGQLSIASLDSQAKYSFKLHTPGENASALIYACAMADFNDINLDHFDIVAVTGNSMGWYIAMALAGALNEDAAIRVINTMGSMMSQGLIGGQLIYPEMDDTWRPCPLKTALIEQVLQAASHREGCELFTSIYLGGYRVLAGNDAGLALAEAMLPNIDDRYPLRLYNHGAFHSPLMQGISASGMAQLPLSLFTSPHIPLIDGEGRIWAQHSTDVSQLRQYTLEHQVIAPYDFTKAVEVAIKEFAPDRVIVLGPGNSLNAPVAQSLMGFGAFGWHQKTDFTSTKSSTTEPILIAMGNAEQRSYATLI